MGDFVELLRLLTGTGDAVIPWLIIALVSYTVYKLIPYTIEWLKARAEAEQERIKAEKGMIEQEAQRNEILRNNNVVIENCTQTMKMTESYLKAQKTEIIKAMDNHEELSAERISHLQTVLNRNGEQIGKIRGDVGILLDRKDG